MNIPINDVIVVVQRSTIFRITVKLDGPVLSNSDKITYLRTAIDNFKEFILNNARVNLNRLESSGPNALGIDDNFIDMRIIAIDNSDVPLTKAKISYRIENTSLYQIVIRPQFNLKSRIYMQMV